MMLTINSLTKLALAIGLGVALISNASSPSMAQSFGTNGGNYYYEPEDNGSVWSNYQGYNDDAARAYGRAENDDTVRLTVRSNGAESRANAGIHYYQGDDNGSVWSNYPGYEPLR